MAEGTCATPGCGRQAAIRGLCKPCHKRGRRAGTLPLIQPKRTPLERLMSKVDRSGECWMWTGSLLKNGYGQIFDQALGRPVMAHQFAFEQLKGPIPDGMEPDHRCHNEDLACPGGWSCLHRRCVNPDHLEAVTHAENMRRLRERRQRQLLGGLCPQGLHLMAGDNVYIVPSTGVIKCRTCVHASHRKWRETHPR